MVKKIKKFAGGGRLATYANLLPEEKNKVDAAQAADDKEYQAGRDRELRLDKINRFIGGLGRALNMGAPIPGETDVHVRPEEQYQPPGTTYYPTSGPGEQPKFKKGGSVRSSASKRVSVKSSASRRGDGIAQKGKTRGKMV